MPKKIRELEAELKRAGFVRQSAKGSHRKWVHLLGVSAVVSGQGGHDARPYQEKDVKRALAELAEKKENQK